MPHSRILSTRAHGTPVWPYAMRKFGPLLAALFLVGAVTGCQKSFVTIASPQSGLELHGPDVGNEVSFRAISHDIKTKRPFPEGALVWSQSLRDGTARHEIGRGHDFTVRWLDPRSCGYYEYLIWATATDGDGEEFEDSVEISQSYVC
jgi:hypothetical protein